jgi:predicted transcriptional regulator
MMCEKRRAYVPYIFVLFLIGLFLMPQMSVNVSANGVEEPINPFRTYYSEPKEITDMIIDSETNMMYIGCEYGLIVKEIDSEDFRVISYFDGLENSYIISLELDKEHSHLYILVKGLNDVFVLDLNTLKIIEKYRLDSLPTMVHAAEFKHMFYEAEKNLLYLGEDSGIAVLNITSKEFDFYDIFFFDVNFSVYEIIDETTLHAETADYFSINGFDYNPGTSELYIATSAGLTVFNTTSKVFENYRNDSMLAGYVYDVLYAENLNMLFLGKDRLVRYNLIINESVEYPFILDEYNDTLSIFSLSFDSNLNIVYASLYGGHHGFAIFDADSFNIKEFNREEYHWTTPRDDTIPNFQFHDAEGIMYIGIGRQILEGTKWIVNYTFEEEITNTLGDEFGIKIRKTNKRLDYEKSCIEESTLSGGDVLSVLFGYDYINDRFTSINLTNILFIDDRVYDVSNHPKTGITMITDRNRLWLINPNGTINRSMETQDIEAGSWDDTIHDIEFVEDLAYMASDKGIKVMNLSTGQIWNITDSNLTDCISLDIGKISGKLYVGTYRGISVFDPSANKSISYSLSVPGTTWNIGGLVVDKQEDRVYFSSDVEVYELNLINESFVRIHDRDNYGKFAIHLSSNTPIVTGSNRPLISFNSNLFDSFPRTGTISSLYVDQEQNILYVATGVLYCGSGGVYRYSTEYPNGVIIYDLINKTFVNYSTDHGLPSNSLSGIAYDPINRIIHITGHRFYAAVNESDLQKNITRKEVPIVSFAPTEVAQQVLGFKGKEDNTIIYLGTTGGIIAGLLAFLLVIFEPLKIKFLTSFANPLYTRIKKDEVMDHETRGRIRGYIESDPGIHYNELKRKLKLKNGTLSYHLQVLEREGFIRSKNNGVYKHFFPGDKKLPTKIIRMTKIQKLILKQIMDNPGISQKKIAKLIGIGTSTVNYNIDKMAKKGIIDIRRNGNETECYIVEDN